jgi:hypothetical protein
MSVLRVEKIASRITEILEELVRSKLFERCRGRSPFIDTVDAAILLRRSLTHSLQEALP